MSTATGVATGQERRSNRHYAHAVKCPRCGKVYYKRAVMVKHLAKHKADR